MRLKDLPKEIYDLAVKNIKIQHPDYKISDVENDSIGTLFVFIETDEGYTFWNDVRLGKLTTIPSILNGIICHKVKEEKTVKYLFP